MFRAGRLACPECGSDDSTGWRDAEDLDYMSVEIPDSWDEDAVMGRRPITKQWWFLAAAVAALAGMLVFVLR